MTELKPCPFCGGKVGYNHNINLEPDGIWCKNCQMLVRYPRIKVDGGEPFQKCMEKFAEAWNRRTP